MLKFINTIVFILVFISSKAQITFSNKDTLRATLTKVFQKVKQLSVYSQQVNWNILETQVLKDTTGYLSFDDFKQRIQLLFSTIGDKHAVLYVNGNKITANNVPHTAIRSSLVNQLKNAKLQLHTSTLEVQYGYLFIPANSLKDNLLLMAQAIQDSLCKLLSKPTKGIIIDLRVMEGGSIYPLFTGVHQLIGEGFFGAFTNIDSTTKTRWKLKKGKFYQQGKIVASVKTKCNCTQKIKIAVLLSQITASAGEMLAIALKGRKNTIFIGEETYGLTTGNVVSNINGHLLAVSASYTQDRTGKVYYSTVKPDIEFIEGDNFIDILKDKKVAEALRWLSATNSH